MLFSLIDYIQYRLRSGQYGEHQRDGGMGALAFEGSIPEDVVAGLDTGDVIFTQRLDRILSWAVMYFGSSPVDHVAMYIGDGRVLHMTLGGSKTDTLRALAVNARVLIIKDGASVVKDEKLADGAVECQTSWFHNFPPKVQLTIGAIKIILGFYPASFRWKFFADILISSVIVDAIIYWLFHIFFAVPIALVFGCIIGVNLMVYGVRKWKGKPFQLLSHPDIGYRNFYRNGGRMVTKLGTLVVCDFGLVPLKMFLALREQSGLGGQSSDDSADNKFQESCELSGNSAEEGDVEGVFSQSEYKDGNQDKN